MVQIKLSIAFVLAAAAINIAPVVAQPVGERGEFGGHLHHDGRGGEFGVGHRGRREGHDSFHHGEGHDGLGGVPHHHHHSLQEPTPEPNAVKILANHYKVLPKKGQPLAREDNVLPKEGDVLAHGPAVHSKVKFVAREFEDMFERDSGSSPLYEWDNIVSDAWRVAPREYAGSGDMFERDLENVESGAKILPHFRGLLPSGHGPVVPHRRHNGPFTGTPVRPYIGRPYLGHLPVIHRPPFTPHRPNFGPGPVVLRHGPAKPEVVARDYAGVEDVFERDFEDAEFDARDFDDELYLD